MEENYEIAYNFAIEAYKKFQHIIKSIVLFGSVAKDLKKQNDIDIIIFIDDCTIQWDEELIAWYREELQKILANNKNRDKLHINTVTLSVFWDEFKSGEPVAINIVRYGKTLVDFGGFFEPLKILLARGKIKPSAEAIYNALRRAPFHLARARYGIYLAVDSLYWAMVDSAHAALMIADKVAPSPEHIPEMLEEYFVKKRMLDKKYVRLYREIYSIIHSLNKTNITIPSKKIDEYQKDVDNFVGEMARIVKKLE
ncbi:nucleotidyltransferase domain-containing protein [Candidatus Woesearchaeota archaeon]|nr:nucleotidyltransferase domain-containing protein [Candidatus Woesearchaeota archaeon]